jgi:hypothetical protein
MLVHYKGKWNMKKYVYLVAFVFGISFVAKGKTPKDTFKIPVSHHYDFIDSIQKRVVKILPQGWTLKRYAQRLVVSKTDSAYIEFQQPLNPDYFYIPNDTIDHYTSDPKYKVEIYVDIALSVWSDSTMKKAEKHNDSIRAKMALLKQQDIKARNAINQYYIYETEFNYLQVQLINLPLWYGNYDIFISDNRPFQAYFLYINKRSRIGDDWLHRDLDKEIKGVKDNCSRAINGWMNKK